MPPFFIHLQPKTTKHATSKLHKLTNKYMKILIVDDSQMIRELLHKALTTLGLSGIDSAENGLEAFEKLKQQHKSINPYDLIFCDWNMPEMSGIELLAMVKALDDYKHIPFVMITAEAESEKIIKSLKLGAAGYIIKPFTLDSLAKTIKNIKTHPKSKPS